jgi:hypothetical protein
MNQPIHIHLILPNGFRAAILVYENQKDGVQLIEKGRAVTISVPTTGVVRVKHRNPFFQSYNISAAYADGRPIPRAGPGSIERVASDTIAF